MVGARDPILRGQAWFLDLHTAGEKPFVVVSNNRRNARRPTVVVVRVSTASVPGLPTNVPLTADEPLRGSVLCDDPIIVPKARFKRPAGALSKGAMERVSAGLAIALGLRT